MEQEKSLRILLLVLMIIVCIVSILFYSKSIEVDVMRQTYGSYDIASGKSINEYQTGELKEFKSTIESQKMVIRNLNQTLSNVNAEFSWLKEDYEKLNEINSILRANVTYMQFLVTVKANELDRIDEELKLTTTELDENVMLLNKAKKFEERVIQGLDRGKAHELLSRYEKTAEIVHTFTDTSLVTDDVQLWSKVTDVYNWLGNNFAYCSDKGFCIGDDCYVLHYFSPDEITQYGERAVICGDCDDYAHLFVGMLYAAGVPHDKARVECGTVTTGGHCWTAVNVDSKWLRIDPVCSNPAKYINFFGYSIQISGKEFPVTFTDVDCFDSYTTMSWYTADEYNEE